MRVPVSVLTASGHGTYRGLFALACLLLWGCALAIVGDQRVARAQAAPLRYEEFEGWQAVPDWRSRPAPRDSRTPVFRAYGSPSFGSCTYRNRLLKSGIRDSTIALV